MLSSVENADHQAGDRQTWGPAPPSWYCEGNFRDAHSVRGSSGCERRQERADAVGYATRRARAVVDGGSMMALICLLSPDLRVLRPTLSSNRYALEDVPQGLDRMHSIAIPVSASAWGTSRDS